LIVSISLELQNEPDGDREIKLFPGDNHSLTKHAEEAEEMLCDFIVRYDKMAVGEGERKDVLQRKLEDKERLEDMKKGGDLGGLEKLA
jgi:hypothetical protein